MPQNVRMRVFAIALFLLAYVLVFTLSLLVDRLMLSGQHLEPEVTSALGPDEAAPAGADLMPPIQPLDLAPPGSRATTGDGAPGPALADRAAPRAGEPRRAPPRKPRIPRAEPPDEDGQSGPGASVPPRTASPAAASCLAALQNLGFKVETAPPKRERRGCGYSDAVRVSGTAAALPEALIMSCPLALAYARFESEVVQPMAERHLGSKIVKLERVGTYTCRSVNGMGGKLSAHARGLALDIGGLVAADGRRISVTRDYRADSAEGRFMRALGGEACRYFETVLTPRTDVHHAHHLHFDLLPRGTCSFPRAGRKP